ncbi:uncharacterized protein L969DRAFT_230193 [Mixia osmundae IAM 14324]|uniref:Uncharacterized protein n=1 Tax=Mixia osmundae (strain CBS 9802 / IAM 14324 / JCM 22182 / KY 12970) TaxID=764103 RepID=G7E2B7_MIXOS|nr:uncharacterized protein L969DRAFT_230193 [Mixia osmundae IAM 14324]KEI36849.1 hypothetical protein L969DRAFT_230193 [Mixia osmundae IAM 14324]GAA96977.1 hypothetical protein E5Q_03651 [Mixia osmundae IAM 14324]
MYKTFAVVLMLVSGLAAMPANSHAVVGDNSNSGVGGNAAKNTAALGNRWCTLSLTDAVHQTYNINFSLLYLEDDNKYFEILDEGSPFAFPNLRAKASSYLGYDAAEFKFPTGQPAQIDITFYSISAEGLLTYHLSPSTVKGHGLTAWNLACSTSPNGLKSPVARLF